MRYPPPRPLFFAIARTGRSHLLDAVFGNVRFSQPAAFSASSLDLQGILALIRGEREEQGQRLGLFGSLGQSAATAFGKR